VTASLSGHPDALPSAQEQSLLVGEAGVGKTAIAEGLARRSSSATSPKFWPKRTSTASTWAHCWPAPSIAATFEQRLKGVLKQLSENPQAILFIDEIHTLIGAGSASGGTLDASNLLKPALSTGQLKCIGATTYNEYRGIFEKDHALSRRFQKIDVNEPSSAEAVEILKGLKSRFEAHHGIKYSAAALTSAVELSVRFITDRHLPDKAIDVIDEAGAAQRILPKSRQKKLIGKIDIEEIVAKIARIPSTHVSSDDRNNLRNLDRDLKAVVFGQDAAIDALARAIKMARSGLGNPTKPIGSFLFSGPTGVGKTEVAKQLAYCLGNELVRFDMSEYMERHAVSRLIGAPPGYVGFDQGGLLTEAVTKKPYSVLLLDEIEKAHPDIYNILLQVMDHGTLTDNNGRKADFRNVVIIMTTNAGQEAIQKTTMGFTPSRQAGDEMAEIKRIFTPEFRNRLDATISFKALDHEVILRVVDKFLMQLEAQLHEKKVEAVFTTALKEHLAAKGFDPLMGARPMARLIQDTIRASLADELLFGRLANGGHVTVDLDEDKKVKLIFEEEPRSSPEPARRPPGHVAVDMAVRPPQQGQHMSFKTPDLLDNNEARTQDGRVRVVAPMFQHYGGRSPSFSGQIVTLKVFEDNSLVREALAETKAKGKVLVIDGGGSLRCALVGDQLAILAHKNGWEGIVVYGCIRDSEDISHIDLGLRALNTHPLKSIKKGIGDRDLAVSFGGVTFRPGEWIYVDGDGVVVSDQRLS
jgi:ATP-dependent Clp protease ATP-binding subunit ClpA